MNKVLSEFIKSFYTGDFTNALTLYVLLKKKCKEIPEISSHYSGCKEYIYFKEGAKALKNILNIAFIDSWIAVRQQEDVLIETSQVNDSFYIRMKFDIESSPLSVLAIFYETEMLPLWVETVKSAKVIENLSLYKKRIHILHNLPWPLNNRESVLSINCLPMPEVNSILLSIYTPEEYKSEKGYENRINMVLPSSGVWIKCLKKKTEVTILIEANKYIVSFI